MLATLIVAAASACDRSEPGSGRASSPSPSPSPSTPPSAPALSSAPAPAQAGPEPAAASAAGDAASAEWPAINLRACGLTLRHPPSFFATRNLISKNPLREVALIEDLPGTREHLAGKGPPGEWPLTLHFASHSVAKDADPVRWLRSRPGPKVAPSAIRRITVAGLPALFYHVAGDEALVDGVVWSCPGRIVEARAPFYGPDERMRREFARILTMIEVQGAPVQNPARCTPPGLPCSSPRLSTCVDGRWVCS